MTRLSRDEYLDLLADLHTLGLSPADEAALTRAQSEHGESDRNAMDLAAAALHLCFVPASDRGSLPAGLRNKLLRSAEGWTPVSSPLSSTASFKPRLVAPPQSAPLPAPGLVRPSRSGLSLARMGWIAAAAGLALAAAGWWQALNSASKPDGPRWAQPVAKADARRDLLQQPGVVVAAWGDFKHPASGEAPEQPGVQGDVAWCERLQTGYLRFVGLKPNDPAKEQYQLWIIDERGMNQRISGAIFDASEQGETIVKIDPRLHVRSAAAFAVTIEQPGGTWVSDMTRRVTLAALPPRG
jgi:hypothetical protein